MSDPITSAPLTIIGSGLAAYTLAREIRKHDRNVSMSIITRDHGHFYSKPSLSNALSKKQTGPDLVLKTSDEMSRELNATVRPFTQITEIVLAENVVKTAASEHAYYSRLVLALGSDSLRLPFLDKVTDRVLSVNDLDEFIAVQKRLALAMSVAVIGGGLVGCELANDLVSYGLRCTLINDTNHLLSRFLPAQASDWLQSRLNDAGVNVLCNQAVTAVEDGGDSVSIRTADGNMVQADLVVSAVGLRARTTLAKTAGIATNHGIVVDNFLRTSNENVYALGDCAETMGRVQPYVLPIMSQAKSLASTLTGKPLQIDYPLMPIVVKTPCAPIVICKSGIETKESWQIDMSPLALEGTCRTATGSINGFVLMGEAVKKRQVYLTALKSNRL
jgi:rubredoxin---NAD+ reductase